MLYASQLKAKQVWDAWSLRVGECVDILVLKIANDSRVMKGWTNSRLQNMFAWGLTGLIVLAAVVLLISPFLAYPFRG